MKHWILALLLALPIFSQPAHAEVRDPAKYFFDAKLGNFQDELAEAKAQGKQGILLFFELDDCPFCARMKATVLNQSEVQDYFRKHFLSFPIDVAGDVPMTDFSGRELKEKDYALENRVRATPVILFINLEGKPVARHTGATRDVNDFMLLGRYVVEQAYTSMPFERYKKAQAAGK